MGRGAQSPVPAHVEHRQVRTRACMEGNDSLNNHTWQSLFTQFLFIGMSKCKPLCSPRSPSARARRRGFGLGFVERQGWGERESGRFARSLPRLARAGASGCVLMQGGTGRQRGGGAGPGNGRWKRDWHGWSRRREEETAMGSSTTGNVPDRASIGGPAKPARVSRARIREALPGRRLTGGTTVPAEGGTKTSSAGARRSAGRLPWRTRSPVRPNFNSTIPTILLIQRVTLAAPGVSTTFEGV